MRSLRSPAVVLGLILATATVLVLAQPRPSTARADLGGSLLCGAENGGVGILEGIAEDITGGAIGGGNPAGDLCGKVAGKVTGAITSPVTNALKGVGDDVFKEMTRWVSEGAGWLMGKVVEAVDSSTTPHLRRDGFLSEYTKMSAIAVLLAVAALLAAILQGIAQGNAGLLLRVVFVNTPLAFIGTSIAFVVVQLLVGATDSLCHAVTAGTGDHGSQLFEAAIGDLGKVGGEIGEAGTGGGISAAQAHNAGQAAVPLFVGFLLAVAGAFAALCVLLELLMRDAGIYAVSLFMPFALYASISPRWRGVMRKYAEGLFALIESKFIIVAIITLAGTLVAKEDTSVEVVLVATALMAMACFAPVLLFRVVAVSEGAAAASLGRRSAGGAVVGGASRTAYTARTVAGMAGLGGNRGGSGEAQGGSGVRLWNARDLARKAPARPGGPAGAGSGTDSKPGGGGGTNPKHTEGPPRPRGGASDAAAGGSAGRAAGAAAAGAGPASAAGAVGKEAGRAPQRGTDRLADTGVARSAGDRSPEGDAGRPGRSESPVGAASPDRPQRAGDRPAGGGQGVGAERAPRPEPARPPQGDPGSARAEQKPTSSSERPPRPPSERPVRRDDGEPGARS